MYQWSGYLRRGTKHLSLVAPGGVIITLGILLLMVMEYLFRVRFQVPVILPYIIYWLVLSIIFSALTILSWVSRRDDEDRLLVRAFFAGIIIGLIVALFKMIVHRELWTVFNLLAEPVRTALFGLVVVWIVSKIEPATSSLQE